MNKNLRKLHPHLLLILGTLALGACTRSTAPAPTTTKATPAHGETPVPASAKSSPNSSLPSATEPKRVAPIVIEENLPGGVRYSAGSVLSQRGFIFEVRDPSTLVMRGLSPIAEVVLMGPPQLMTVRIGRRLDASTLKTGPGGFAPGTAAGSKGGFDVYVVAKAKGEQPALILSPTGNQPRLPEGYTHISEPLWFVYIAADGIRDFLDYGNGHCQYYGDLTADPTQHRFPANIVKGVGVIPFRDLVPAFARTVLLQVTVQVERLVNPGSFVQFFYKPKFGLLHTLYPVPGLAYPHRYSVMLEVPILRGNRDQPLFYRFSAPLNGTASSYILANVMGWTALRTND